MCCNRQIRGFSAGQKVRLSLAAMFWTKPHLIAVDEPTNYLDVETVEALAKALTTFRGGIVMIEPKTDFVERICNEKWHLEDPRGEVRGVFRRRVPSKTCVLPCGIHDEPPQVFRKIPHKHPARVHKSSANSGFHRMHPEDGVVTVEKLQNGAKRMA
jgi:energy-coupling factor transporter ATP-binding protein EcfA2